MKAARSSREARGSVLKTPASTLIWPALALTALFMGYPAARTAYGSLFDMDDSGELTRFVGWDNYSRLLSDSQFWQSFYVTLLMTVVFVVGTVGVGTVLAVALYWKIPGHKLWRFAILLPFFLPLAFIGQVWQTGLSDNGWATSLLSFLHLGSGQSLLDSQLVTLLAMSLVWVAQAAGFPMILVWTTLQEVPGEVIDAATIDGAGIPHISFGILLPFVKNTVFVVAMLQTIYALKAFDVPWIMTHGGPVNATTTMTIFVYKSAFVTRSFGYANAAAVLTSVLVAAITVVGFAIARGVGRR